MYLLYLWKKKIWINEDLNIIFLRVINFCFLCKFNCVVKILFFFIDEIVWFICKKGEVDFDVNIRYFFLGILVSLL